MAKFHINPETGKAGKCTATVQDCKYAVNGTVPEHYENEEQAHKAFESIMKKATFRKMKKDRKILLSDSLDLELLNNMIERGYVKANAHKQDPSLKVLCYTPMAQISGKWNEATKLARGLIVRSDTEDFSDAVIVQRPWKKFYTLQQIQGDNGKGGWALGDEEDGAANAAHSELDKLDFDAKAEVTDKLDGSLGILYTAPDGTPAFSTKGSFDSDQAKYFSKWMKINESYSEATQELLKNYPNTTFTFELVGDADGLNEHVLEYESEDIIMLGAIDKASGKYYSVKDFNKDWADKGLPVAETMEANNLREAFAMPDRINKEGVVVRIINDDPDKQMQIKIKQDDYLMLHKVHNGFSKKNTRAILNSLDLSYDEVFKVAETGDISNIQGLHNLFEPLDPNNKREIKLRNKFKNDFTTKILSKAQQLKNAKDYIDALPQSSFDGDPATAKKNFAMSLNKSDKNVDFGNLFKFFDRRLAGEEVDWSTVSASSLAKNVFKDL